MSDTPHPQKKHQHETIFYMTLRVSEVFVFKIWKNLHSLPHCLRWLFGDTY